MDDVAYASAPVASQPALAWINDPQVQVAAKLVQDLSLAPLDRESLVRRWRKAIGEACPPPACRAAGCSPDSLVISDRPALEWRPHHAHEVVAIVVVTAPVTCGRCGCTDTAWITEMHPRVQLRAQADWVPAGEVEERLEQAREIRARIKDAQMAMGMVLPGG